MALFVKPSNIVRKIAIGAVWAANSCCAWGDEPPPTDGCITRQRCPRDGAITWPATDRWRPRWLPCWFVRRLALSHVFQLTDYRVKAVDDRATLEIAADRAIVVEMDRAIEQFAELIDDRITVYRRCNVKQANRVVAVDERDNPFDCVHGALFV